VYCIFVPVEHATINQNMDALFFVGLSNKLR
jgi:hypothetical protein